MFYPALKLQTVPSEDDRITCQRCANLCRGFCQADKRQFRPVVDLLRRCLDYVPAKNEQDKRKGRQRWPGLVIEEQEFLERSKSGGLEINAIQTSAVKKKKTA